MRLRSILIALSALFCVGTKAYDVSPQPEVGISLSSGYATVSALLPDGSYIDIAKVEGGPAYKAYMLGSRVEPVKTASATYCPFSQRICQLWPLRSIQTQNPLAPMLKAIVASVESALETTINNVAVSAYDVGSINHELAEDHVHTALGNLGVESYSRLDHVARQLAPVLGIQGNCSEPYVLPEDPAYYHDPSQLVFTVEYTRDSMTAGLWREECGVMEMTNRWNTAELGHNAMQNCRETAKDKTTCEEAFKLAIRSVSQGSNNDKHSIGPVLIFGESANDDAMLIMVQQVLEEQSSKDDSVDFSRMDFSRVRHFSPDPAFAGSRAMAGVVREAHGPKHEGHPALEL